MNHNQGDEDLKIYDGKSRRPTAVRPGAAPSAAPAKAGGQAVRPSAPGTAQTRRPVNPEAQISSGARQEASNAPVKRKKRRTAYSVLLYVLLVILSAGILAVVTWVVADDVLALTKPDRIAVVEISESDNISDITDKLKNMDLIKFPLIFRIYAGFSNADERIDSGTYELNNMYDYRALVVGMGAVSEARMTVTLAIPEGYEQEQIFQLLADNGVCELRDLQQTAASYDFDYDFLMDLELNSKNRLEGYLFPDTYDFFIDEDPVSVINKFLANFDRKFDSSLRARIEGLNEEIRENMTGIFAEEEIQDNMMDIHKIVIIASLIEKEAANNSERTTISSVIHNRLTSKLYPALEIDATIQYALEERKESLTYNDLAIDSPYNTYNRPGLPVGPIANPGIASIRAALYPEQTEYYFYALDVDGAHHYSRFWEEHRDFLNGLENDEAP